MGATKRGKQLTIRALTEGQIANFERLWLAYPKRGRKEKGESQKAFEKIYPTHEQCEQMILAAELYGKYDENVQRGFVKMLATWLNKGCWKDDYSPDGHEFGRKDEPEF